VVAGDDRHAPAGHRAPDLAEHRPRGSEHVADGPLAQLQEVAQQHELVDAIEGPQQRLERRRPAQQVAAAR
jgi:hypothetical protein